MHASLIQSALEPKTTRAPVLAADPVGPGWLRRSFPMLALLLITVAGGALRFFHLNRPCLWGDEALVYWRTCGNYAELLEPLRTDGFGPLHYELEWLIGHFFKPTPFVLRLPPAVCGTLMIPGIYLLARQMLPRSTSLVAAAYAAFSGFLIFYSRDAKMYMETWCFATTSAACLLWWLRTRRSTAWLCWIATGAAACGIHASAMAIVALSPLFLLTHRSLHWKQAVWIVAGLMLIFAGPVGYYTKFNQFVDRVEDEGWRATGIQWVDWVNRGMNGPQIVRAGATALTVGWAWPKEEVERDVAPKLLKWQKWAAELLLSLALTTTLPWPRFMRPRDHAHPLESAWRVLLWLSLWILLPGYIFYCRSVDNFDSPLSWLDPIVAHLPSTHTASMTLIAIAAAALFAGAVFRITRPVVQKIFVIAAMFGLLWAIYSVMHPAALNAMLTGEKWHSIWVPRYLGFIWPALGLAAAALLMRLPTIPIRIAAVVLFLGINLAFGASRFIVLTEPPVDQMAQDIFDAQDANSPVRTYTDIPHGDPNPAGGTILSMPGRYYLQMLAWHQPMTPSRFRDRSINEYTFRGGYHASTIADEVHHSPQLHRVVVWDDYPVETKDEPDTLGPMLGKDWKLASDRWYRLYTFWDWIRRSNFRRREYVR